MEFGALGRDLLDFSVIWFERWVIRLHSERVVSLEAKVAIGASESVRISVSKFRFRTPAAFGLKRCRPRLSTKGGWYDTGGGRSAGPLFTCGISCSSLGYSPTTSGSLRIIRQILIYFFHFLIQWIFRWMNFQLSCNFLLFCKTVNGVFVACFD